MATPKKPKNLIPSKTLKKHYRKDGTWKLDKPDTGGYDDVTDYAAEHPEYVFTRTEHSAAQINPQTGKPYKYTNKYVGIHDTDFAKDLGASVFGAMSAGGSVVRVGERKVK